MTSKRINLDHTIRDLTFIPSGMTGVEMGKISDKDNSWRHNIVEVSKPYRLKLVKQMTDPQGTYSRIQLLAQLIEDMSSQLHEQVMYNKRQKDMLGN